MTHWHIVSWSPDKGVYSHLRYDNAAQSIGDYIDLSYRLFHGFVDEEDRITYMNGMLKMTEETSGYHIYTKSKRMTLSWTDCMEDPCSYASDN